MKSYAQVTSPQTAKPPETGLTRPNTPRAAARPHAIFRGLRTSAHTAALALLLAAAPAPACAQGLTDTQHTGGHTQDDAAQGAAAAREKRARTPAQAKIDSQLLQALYRKRGEAATKGVPAGELSVRFDEEGRALVTVRARPIGTVMAKIKRLGGVVLSHSERYDDIRAAVPLEKLEKLAALKEVRAIMPAEEATTNDGATH
jgi:hypothetical protein